jgi:uncharacterized protein YegL
MVSSVDRVAWPFYIVCDVSESMHRRRRGHESEVTPYEAMHEGLLELVNFAEDEVQVADIAHLGLVTFADDTNVVLPLRKMSDGFGIEPLPKGTFTDYAKLFTTLSDVIASDISELERRNIKVKRPAVFFITDGRPEVKGKPQSPESWQEPLRRLHALTAPRSRGRDLPIAVVALGFGGAECANLRLVAQKPGIACIADAGVAAPHELMLDLLTSILNSITNSAEEGDLVFTPPRGMKPCG